MIGSTVAISALFSRLALLFRVSETGFTGLFDNVGTRDRDPLSAESTMSDVNEGVPVFIRASIF